MRRVNPIRLLLLTGFLVIISFSCTTIDLYEKSVSIPGHVWSHNFRPAFDFVIKDTSSPYKIFLVLRHNEKYNFNNIYLNLLIKAPGQDSVIKVQKDLLLATNDKGWLGAGMDDIYEHRIEMAEMPLRAGAYHFSIEQIMREDPLENVLNAGLRLEKQ